MLGTRLSTLVSIYSLSILMLCGCTNRISPDELTGGWEVYGYSDDLTFDRCFFTSTRASFTGKYGYPHVTDYEVENGIVLLSDARWAQGFSFTAERIDADTLFLGNGNRYVRSEDTKHWPTYELPSVPGGNAPPPQQKSTNRVILHFYPDSVSGKPVLRYGPQAISPNELPLLLYQGHTTRTEVILFAGRDLSLVHLRQLFFALRYNALSYIYLVADHRGFEDFTLMKDYLPIWWEELESLSPAIPLPPPPLYSSRAEFIRAPDTREISIESIQDTSIVADLPGDYVYLVSVSPELDLSDYLWIKQCLARREKQGEFIFRLDIDLQAGALPSK